VLILIFLKVTLVPRTCSISNKP